MQIDVAFSSSEVQAIASKLCIVVDVLRTTTSAILLAYKRPQRLIITPTISKAFKYASQQTSHPILIGERDILKPDGFDFSLSPIELAEVDIRNKIVVLSSSNCGRTIADLQLAAGVYLGAFINSNVLAEVVLERAFTEGLDISIVCSGRQEKFCIDDTYCAGFLVSVILSKIPATQNFELGEGAQASLAILSYFRDANKLFNNCLSGKDLIKNGFEKDIEYSLQKDIINCVPMLKLSSENKNYNINRFVNHEHTENDYILIYEYEFL